MVLFLLLGGGRASASKWYATWGANVGSGSWDSETSTYTWTQAWSNLITIFDTSGGKLSGYTGIHLKTSEYKDVYRLYFRGPDVQISFHSAGEKNIVFAERSEFNGIDLSTITGIEFGGASGQGTIKVEDVYLIKPTQVEFNSDGEYSAPLADISVNSGNITYDPTNGQVTIPAGESGSLKLDLGTVDFTDVTTIYNDFSSFDAWYNSQIYAGSDNKGGFWGSKDVQNLNAEKRVQGVTHLLYNVNNSGDSELVFTINSIKIKANTIQCVKGGEIDMTTLPYVLMPNGSAVTPANNIGTTNDPIYGTHAGEVASKDDGGNITYHKDGGRYVDLTDYTQMRIYKQTEEAVRLFMIGEENFSNNLWSVEQVRTDDAKYSKWNAEEYCYVIDIQSLPKNNGRVKLQAIKTVAGWAGGSYTTPITSIILYPKTVDSSTPNYTLSGSGVITQKVKDALGDVNATYIDASGLNNTSAIELTTANPNCIITAAEGKLSNVNNVSVNGTIENLVLADGYSFTVPTGVKHANNASYTRTMTNNYGTVVLPFAVSSNSIVQFFDPSFSEDKQYLNLAPLSDVAAGVPAVMKKLSGDEVTITATSVDLAETINNTGILRGCYTQKTQITDANTYYIKNDVFKAINNSFISNAFRAHIQANSPLRAKSLSIIENNDGATSIEAVGAESIAGQEIVAIYDAAGVPQKELKKGVNIVVLANGKKMSIVK